MQSCNIYDAISRANTRETLSPSGVEIVRLPLGRRALVIVLRQCVFAVLPSGVRGEVLLALRCAVKETSLFEMKRVAGWGRVMTTKFSELEKIKKMILPHVINHFFFSPNNYLNIYIRFNDRSSKPLIYGKHVQNKIDFASAVNFVLT